MSDFVIVPKGPFSLPLAAEHLSCFPATSHQPSFVGGVLRLGFVADRTHLPVAVSLRAEAYGGVLHGTVAGSPDVDAVRRQVARIFALDVDARAFPDVAKRDPKLAPVLAEKPGLRPVSFTSPYECACWAVLSQRITKVQAAKIMSRLVDEHGADIGGVRVFPTPERLLGVSHIPSVPAVKLERLHGIALATLEGRLDADVLRKLPEDEALARLKTLPGIGDFWASGLWLRACGVHDRFPDEPISVAALGRCHGLGDAPSPAKLAELTALYRPFGMFVAFLLRVTSREPRLSPRGARACDARA